MPDFASMSLQDLIRPTGYDCGCGKRHLCALDFLAIGPGVLVQVPDMVRAMGCRKPFVVFDENTRKAAGDRVCALLDGAGIPYVPYQVPCRGDRLAPAEWEVGSVLMHFDPACDLLLGVGSGVINDICKVVAHAAGLKNAIVGTAPSMDGYASNSSAMEVNGIKMTLFDQVPQGILLDTDVLCRAPMRMLWAGLGDMAAKFISVCEWRISHIVTGEYYCEDVAGLMRSGVRKVIAAADGIPQHDPQAIQAIAEGLVISGIAMAYAGISRPASGLEHQFSHIWEMMALDRGRPYDLHGIQVGVSTMLMMKLYRKFRTIRPDRATAEAWWRAMTPEKWEAMIRRIFGRCAPDILALETIERKNDPAAHEARLSRIIAHWDDILSVVNEELPAYESLRGILAKTGMPLRPSEIGISVRDTVDAFLGSRDVRNKYQSSTLLWDLGLTEEFAGYLEKVAESE